MLVTKIIGCGLLIHTVCGIGITTIKSKKLDKETKINNYRKNINITNKQDKTELHIKDEIKRITISDIKNWISKKDIDGYKLFIDKEEARKFGENLYGNWSRNLINKYDIMNWNDELNPYRALKYYSGSVYRGVNEYLRDEVGNGNYFTDSIKYYNDIIGNIDMAFSNVPVTDENIIVFRHVGLHIDDLINYYYSLKEGDEIKDKGYMSTSLILDIAVNFHGEIIDSSYALLVIKIPKGEKCIFIDAVDGYIEYEMLISKNKTLKLEKILVKNDKQMVLLCTL